jgi:long-chain acyl-CoA synthetase
VQEDDLFGIYYTGGTTGLAKGVMLSHKNILSNAYHFVTALGLRDDQVGLHSAPMFHLADGSSNFAITMVGGAHVMVKAFEPVTVLKAIDQFKPTLTLWVPTMINMLVNHPQIGDYDLSSLKYILYGASPISPDLLKKAIDVFQCDFVQLYGMTEAGPILTLLSPEDHKKALASQENEFLLNAAGRQIIGVDVRVVDESGRDVNPGEVGEIIARGDNIMQGYWNKPKETAVALIDGWYWSKDLARIDESQYVYIVDRAKDMIVSGGENVYSVEVEDALSAHSAVLEVAVLGVPHDEWGEAVKSVVALKPGASATEEELQTFCKQRIAGYKVPKSIDFIEELPKSGAGKILKKDLREKYWKGIERRVS